MASAARSYFKKGLKAPDRAVVLSLVAVLIVCAAPCFVSYMDAQVTEGVYSEVDDLPEISLYQYHDGTNVITDMSTVQALMIDGDYYIRNTTAGDISTLYFGFFNDDETPVNVLKDAIAAGASHFVITFDEDTAEMIDSIGLKFGNAGKSVIMFEPSEDGLTYTLDLDSLDRLYFANNAFIKIECSSFSATSTISFSYTVSEPATDFSGSAVVGFFGIVLIVLALCCTNLINPLRRL